MGGGDTLHWKWIVWFLLLLCILVTFWKLFSSTIWILHVSCCFGPVMWKAEQNVVCQKYHYSWNTTDIGSWLPAAGLNYNSSVWEEGHSAALQLEMCSLAVLQWVPEKPWPPVFPWAPSINICSVCQGLYVLETMLYVCNIDPNLFGQHASCNRYFVCGFLFFLENSEVFLPWFIAGFTPSNATGRSESLGPTVPS